ncbi:serine hydrolase domain-containing protein [Aestuariibius insulae]|uniref:serine hydrolase domain-containing protein n=1 Tax=Aestuariibius insulae TaxID=2058287 RepID=UPI00345E99EF
MWSKAAALYATLLAAPLTADPVLDAMEEGWRSWAEENGIRATAFSVMREGGPPITRALNMDPDAPVILASVTKPITAICLDMVLDEMPWSWATTLSDLRAPLTAAGLTVSAEWEGVTLGALSSMSSGLVTDVTQGGYFRRKNAEKTEDLEQAANSLATERQADAGYVYNNGNYAILGVVIAALTGETTEAACQSRVTAPLGLESARLSDQWRAMGSAGGWEMAPEDLVRFTLALPELTDDAPRAKAGEGAFFAGGSLTWETEDGPFLVMRGALCGGLFGIGDMALILRREDGVAAAVAIKGCVAPDVFLALEETLTYAAGQPEN